MLSIRIDLLTERYYATAFNDRNSAEWPPHPGRLFSALVATWADEPEPDPVERQLLVWLEGLGDPQISCSNENDVARRSVHTYFVPVNDASIHRSLESHYEKLVAAQQECDLHAGDERAVAKSRKKLDKAEEAARVATSKTAKEVPTGYKPRVDLLPDDRIRQPRTFPAVHPPAPSVYFTWPDATPTSEQLDRLDGLLSRLGRLGHSSSLVAASVVAERSTGYEVPEPTYVPATGGGVQLRVMASGLLDALEDSYEQHQGTNPRVLPNLVSSYSNESDPTPAPAGAFSDQWFILAFDNSSSADDGSDSRPTSPPSRVVRDIPLHRALPWTRAFRSAVHHYATRDFTGYIGGHSGDGSPMAGVHPAFVPLGFVGSQHSDGRVRAFALVPPVDITDEQMGGLVQALQHWSASGGGMRIFTNRSSEGLLAIVSGQDLPVSIRPEAWCLTSGQWVSATPIVLERFPKGLHSEDPPIRDAALDHVRQTIRQSIAKQGLPEPVGISIHFDGLLRGSRPVKDFIAYRHGRNSTRRPLSVHAVLEFDQPVRGPLLIGEGRHLGYGLMRPIGGEAS